MTVSSDVRDAAFSAPPLTVSPLARALLAHAQQRSTGALPLGARTLLLSGGELTELSAAPDDVSLEGYLVQSGRVEAATLAQHQQLARSTHQSLPRVLLQQGVVSDAELKLTRRGLLLDRLSRVLIEAGTDSAPELLPGPATYAPDLMGNVALVPLLLDALARVALAADAGLVGSQLNHRIDWLPGPYDALARAWADLGELPARPAVSTVLAKRPAAAPRIAALVRAGLAKLDPPGRALSNPPLAVPPEPPAREAPATSADARPAPASTPPTALETSAGGPREVRERAPREPARVEPVQDAPATNGARRSDPAAAQPGSFRPPRVRFDPGDLHDGSEPLAPAALPVLPRPSLELDDPLQALEAQVRELERDQAAGPERARVFRAIARIWHERFGCIERAARAFREAASADPSDVAALQHAALHCHYLGENELAERYVQCAITAATLPVERAAAQRLRAVIARSAGDGERCIEALCEAAADDPGNSLPHEQVAALLFERDDAAGANAHARLAAMTLQEDQPERALGLLAWALALKPSDVPTAYEYASLLDQTGRRGGAAAILAYAASCSTQPEQRRKLRLAAAERAEASKRTALAAQLLVDAFDAEPHFDLLYGPLDEDLAALELCEYRAVTLEDLATACPDDQRAYWLERAARAMLAAPEQRDAALWLLFEAVLTDAQRAEALPALRAHAASQPELCLLAHALLAVINAKLGRSPAEAAPLLRELAQLADQKLNNPHLALAVLQRLGSMGHGEPAHAGVLERLRAAIQTRALEIEQAEQALAALADPTQRGEACLRLAHALPDLPEHWGRIAELLGEGLRALGPLPALRTRLELLHALRRDAVALAVFLEDQAEVAQSSVERVRLLTRLAAVHTVREDTSAVASTCENLLDLDRGCRIAVARLERAARRLGDHRRLARALELRAGLTRRGDERARVLSQLAQLEEADGQLERAVEHAWEALRADAEAADSSLLLLRHAHLIAPADALRALELIERGIGQSRALLTARAEAAEAVGDGALQRRAVLAWTELMPADAEAHGAWLRLCILDGDAAALRRAAERALDSVQSGEVLEIARVALDRLAALGAHGDAALLAWRLVREQGRKDRGLAARTVDLARKAGNPELLTAALELAAALAEGEARGALLAEISHHHRKRLDPAAELRALQRELELRPGHTAAQARLRELLLETGDGARLLTLVGQQVADSADPAQRRNSLFELVAICAQYLHDRERSEGYVRDLLHEAGDDVGTVRDALGALLAIGEPRWALERITALADEQNGSLASRMYQWASTTAESEHEPELALDIARRGALRWPRLTEHLLAVERLALEREDVPAAMATYDALIAASVGPHGRRALHYRTGRWLERAGLPEQALDRYLEAFALAPTGGAPFRALERVARQTKSVARVVPCYERLAEHVRGSRARVGLLSTAAALCADELSDPARAFELLSRANAFTEHFELDEHVLTAARQLRARDAAAGQAAMLQVVEELEQRSAQIWNAEDKVRLLIRAAALRSGELRQHAVAIGRLTEASALIQSEGLPAALAAEANGTRAEILSREERASAPSATIPPDDEVVLLDLDLVPLPDDDDEPASAQTAVPSGQGQLGRIDAISEPFVADVLKPRAARISALLGRKPPPRVSRVDPDPTPAPEPEPDWISDSDLVSEPDSDSGSVSDSESGSDSVSGSGSEWVPATPSPLTHWSKSVPPEPSVEDLVARYTAEPWRTDLLRALASGDARSAQREARAARLLLATFDSELPAPKDPEFHAALWRGRSLRAAAGADLQPEVGGLLAQLWHYARAVPRFRGPHGEHGVNERDRITRITVGPVAEAYAQVVRTLEATEVPVYAPRGDGSLPQVLATHPPSITVGRNAPHDRRTLQFAIGYALWLAQPEHLIAAVLDPADARDLLDAAWLAFVPSPGSSLDVAVSAKELASLLWQAVPSGAQRELGETLRRHADALDPGNLRLRVRAAGARAALLACGSIRAAVHTLARVEPELDQLELSNEAGFQAACQQCFVLAELVRSAFAPAYLDTLVQVTGS